MNLYLKIRNLLSSERNLSFYCFVMAVTFDMDFLMKFQSSIHGENYR